ncbi:MAG: DUF2844 domain-containing protein [Oligoflexia bacterium]|nr:DUF2844 domain-containing protein [Oligoflexia bacterium]
MQDLTWIAATLLLLCPPSLASLGGSADSIESDRSAMVATRKALAPSAQGTPYTVSILDSGAVTVREYISTATGKVFAVTWEGLTRPDLAKLLGSHYQEYQSEAKKSRSLGRRRASVVQTDGLVVESSGHMRSQRGRAYLPGEIPPGVDIGEIK